MKKDFFAYIRPDEDELTQVWNNAIFTFDANILLNFYRYTSDTTKIFFDLLEKVKDRTWLTHQSVQEYFDNRLTVISEQEKTYSDLKDSIAKSIEEPLNNQRKHPYISQALLAEFKGISSKIKAELDARSQEYSKRLSQDDILNNIIAIFDSKVSSAFDAAKYDEIYKQGQQRYDMNILPGFKDKSKGGSRQYGDLVLWNQIIEIAKNEKKDVIFITDDEKEDCLYIHKGRTIGMLPALQIEFKKLTDKKAFINNAEKFIENIGRVSKTQITKDTIEEVITLREENKLIFEHFGYDNLDNALGEDEINTHISKGIEYLANDLGWAELAQLGIFLSKNTPVNYRAFGFRSLKNFIESRLIFEIAYERKSPNAKNVDAAYVRIKSD